MCTSAHSEDAYTVHGAQTALATRFIAGNLALQGYSRAHPWGGRWLVVFGWGVRGETYTQTTPNYPTERLFARALRASPETNQTQRAMRRMIT